MWRSITMKCNRHFRFSNLHRKWWKKNWRFYNWCIKWVFSIDTSPSPIPNRPLRMPYGLLGVGPLISLCNIRFIFKIVISNIFPMVIISVAAEAALHYDALVEYPNKITFWIHHCMEYAAFSIWYILLVFQGMSSYFQKLIGE